MHLNINFSNNYLPQNNFYLWVNENWKNENKIPKERERWSAFDIQNENINLKIKKLLEEPNKEYIKCQLLYKQGLKRNHNSEIYEYLEDIDKCNNIEQLLNLIIDYQILFKINSPFILNIQNDFLDATTNILHIYTGGLGLPDKSYYNLDSKENIRNEYKIFLKKYSDCFNIKLDIENIYNIEIELAECTYTNIENRNHLIQNNPMYLNEILTKYPSLTCLSYLFKKINKKSEKINIINPKFMSKLNNMFSLESKFKIWKDYFKMKLILSVANYLSQEIEEIYFNFYSKILSGIPNMKPIWERSLINVNNKLGFLIGKYYVEKYFNSESKTTILKMIIYIKEVLYDRINKLDWMHDATKVKAIEKINTMDIKIGSPDKWREYNQIMKKDYSYLKNNILCNLDNFKYVFSKLYDKIDRTEWFMNPHEVNAYYSLSRNEIVFPAGILQEPFFSDKYDIGLNFGGILSIIGHEITHAFDDEGSKYDAKGNLNNWWTPDDFKNYNLKTNNLLEQFNKYSVENESVNGKLTLGENIADLGGVTIALESLKKYLIDNPKNNININNFTQIQRFFINYAIIWASNTRKEEIKNRLLTDVHSPPEFRVNGILKNIDDFYLAFNVKENDLLFLYKKDRVKIW